MTNDAFGAGAGEQGSGGAGGNSIGHWSAIGGLSSVVGGPRSAVILLILLLALALRAWNLTGIPPGLTHDEANHGREAIGILNGVYLYFFPLNYGSEPLYSYTVALFMALLGRGVLALRLVNAFFGTAAVAITCAWAAPRLGRPIALLGAALMAVSFWPLATSREALRAGMLPFFMALAVYAFWRMLEATGDDGRRTTDHRPQTTDRRLFATPTVVRRRATGVATSVVFFASALALTLHIYLAARVSWLLFPAFLGYLALIHRAMFRRAWRPVLAGLLLAGLLVAPMFLYLRTHPEMQTRLDMLDRPLGAIVAGDFAPLLLNARDALLAFVLPGFGDQFLAYNIPGRPVFDAVSAAFFVVGLLVCLWRWRRPVYAFLLLWFLIGIIPSLITGPTANTTRNLAALPAVYLIAAVGFIVPMMSLRSRITNYELRITNEGGLAGSGSSLVTRHSSLVTLLAFALVAFVAFVSARDYFVHWGDSADARGAYQRALVEELRYVEANYPDADSILFSTVYPGPAHDSSIALLLGERPAVAETARWVDARYALVIPPGETLAAIPHSTPPHPAFIPLLEAIETIDIRPDDLDPRFTLYWLHDEAGDALTAGDRLEQPANFNGAIELVAARWLADAVRPGETAELMTVWRVLDPTRAGPLAPPSFTTDAVMFTHVLDGAGGILAQRDGLDAPSWAWQIGDLIAQIHPVVVPESAAPGEYPAVVGIYDRASGSRLPVAGGGDAADAPPLIVLP